jgi:DNA repair exonuclease SbcCD nuclease subunit
MRFVHAADLHLDSPLQGLARYEGAPVDAIRGATRHALENLVDLCLAEGARLLLVAGDLYDGSWKDYSTGLFFAQQMTRLRDAGVHVVWIRGNHDAASRLTQHLRLPDNVRELPVRRPDTIELEDLGIAVHGQGFATAAVTDDLAAAYPPPVPGALNIGLLHTALDGREGHAPYAPCRVDGLVARGYDYWALGHVHARQVVARAPWIVFPGNLQGRHVRETGEKGATLVTVTEGRIADVEHRPLDVVRWEVMEVDVAQAASFDDALDLARMALEARVAAAAGRTLAARVRFTGATRAHAALARDAERFAENVRAVATDAAYGAVWVEQVRVETHPPGAPMIAVAGADADDALGEVLRELRAARDDETTLGEFAATLTHLRKGLPSELRDHVPGDAGAVRALLPAVEQLLVARLTGGSES